MWILSLELHRICSSNIEYILLTGEVTGCVIIQLIQSCQLHALTSCDSTRSTVTDQHSVSHKCAKHSDSISVQVLTLRVGVG